MGADLPSSQAELLIDAYRRSSARRWLLIAALSGACLAALVLDVMTGPSGMSAGEVITGLFAPERLTPARAALIWQARLPYALMALLVGAALAMAGAEMQTILNNPLASPFTLGVSSAASFGASLAIVLGLGLSAVADDWLVSLNAFVFLKCSA